MKPVLNNLPTTTEITGLETQGHAFDMHGDKRIIGRAIKNGFEICFLEDGSEIIRAPNGQFIEEWPEGV